jgi:hypothetical protein
MALTRALFVAIVALALVFAPQFGRWPGIADDAAVAAAQGLAPAAGPPGLHVVAQDDDDDDDDDDGNDNDDFVYSDEPVRTGGGQDPEDFGSSDGVVNPGAEDLGIDEDEDDDD